jgi:hypothetical protein
VDPKPLTPETRRAKLLEVLDAATRSNRQTRREHALTARRRIAAETRRTRRGTP